MHGDGGPFGDECRRRTLVEYTREWRVVKFPQRAVELPAGIGPDVPVRMLDAVFDGPAVALPRVAPLPVGQEFLQRSGGHGLERRLDVECHPTLVARTAELVLDALQL